MKKAPVIFEIFQFIIKTIQFIFITFFYESLLRSFICCGHNVYFCYMWLLFLIDEVDGDQWWLLLSYGMNVNNSEIKRQQWTINSKSREVHKTLLSVYVDIIKVLMQKCNEKLLLVQLALIIRALRRGGSPRLKENLVIMMAARLFQYKCPPVTLSFYHRRRGQIGANR